MQELPEAQRMTGWAEAGETLVGWFVSAPTAAGWIEQFGEQGDEIEMHLSGFRRDSDEPFCMIPSHTGRLLLVLPLAVLRAAEVTDEGRRAWHRGDEVEFLPPDFVAALRAAHPPRKTRHEQRPSRILGR